MKRGFGLGLVFSIFSLVTACSNSDRDKDIDQQAKCVEGELKTVGIFGGKTLSTQSIAGKGVVLVIDGDVTKGLFGICTGSLIDNNIVLTAAHCVPSDSDASKVSVAFAGDPICQVKKDGLSALKKANRLVGHPRFPTDPRVTDSQYDLAMIQLTQKAPDTYRQLPLLNHSVNLNQHSQIFVSGYGRSTDYNDENSGDTILRVAAVRPLMDSDDEKKITKDNNKPILFLDQSQGQGACSGDSGGPTFLKEQGQLYILGVNSAVDSLVKKDFENQKEVTCRRGLRSVSVYALRDWISQTYRSLLNSDSNGNQF